MVDELKPAPPSKRLGQMPRHYHQDDAPWISAKLGTLEPSLRAEVWAAYARAYMEAWQEEPIEHKHHGKARFAANTRLRLFIRKRFAVFNR